MNDAKSVLKFSIEQKYKLVHLNYKMKKSLVRITDLLLT